MTDAAEEIRMLRERLGPQGLEIIIIDGTGHYVNEKVKAEIERLRTAQPQHLAGCLHPGNEPNSCQYEGQCLSPACDHNGKTWLRPRMTLEAQDPNVLYPSKGE